VTVFWISGVLTLIVLAAAMSFGGVMFCAYAAMVLVLPHVVIGDLFHWSHFSTLVAWRKLLWLSLAAFGCALFLVIRQCGEYMYPLFYTYFFWHFWKDLDLGLGQAAADATVRGMQRPKRWCGPLLWIAYLVISSGLVKDRAVIESAKRVAWAAAAGLAVLGLVHLVRARVRGRFLDLLWTRYAGVSAGFLVVCTWLDGLHPDRNLLPYGILILHFMLWYVFYFFAVRREELVEARGPFRGTNRLKHSWVSFAMVVVILHGLSAMGAWAYGTRTEFQWLKYVYDFRYLVGCWVVMHVTWDWLPKEVNGVRLSVI